MWALSEQLEQETQQHQKDIQEANDKLEMKAAEQVAKLKSLSEELDETRIQHEKAVRDKEKLEEKLNGKIEHDLMILSKQIRSNTKPE